MFKLPLQSEGDLLDRFQRAAFGNFLPEVNPENDLTAEPTRKPPASLLWGVRCHPIRLQWSAVGRTAGTQPHALWLPCDCDPVFAPPDCKKGKPGVKTSIIPVTVGTPIFHVGDPGRQETGSCGAQPRSKRSHRFFASRFAAVS